MRFLSKVAVIFNVCFFIEAVLRHYEITHTTKGNFTGLLTLKPLESSIVVLGHTAILVNFIFNLLIAFYLIIKKETSISSWIIWFNFLVLIVQIYYFFFS